MATSRAYAASPRAYANLARERLHPRLAQFFARYPPPALMAAINTTSSRSHTQTVTTAPLTSPADPNETAIETQTTISAPSPAQTEYRSPFLPQRHPITKRTHNPVYSLRRQADLFKLAIDQGVADLLPDSKKNPATRAKLRQEGGLKVRGTGAGQKPKGKKWERTMDERLEVRRQAMINMPRLIERWKQRGHGRRWKNWPK